MMDDPIVTVKQGKLKGVTCQSVLGPTYLAFRGIPYAAPPVGELRFKTPQPPIPWSGVRNASVNGSICGQYVWYMDVGISGSEDCLNLNVYTRSLTGRKPVMFWVHGGSFISGSGNDSIYRPDYLVTQDIVLVSINYRLGALGFLNLNDKAAPGNQGMRDLIAGLEWVKENIANFGGDPDNVTIFGESCGGALVHCLAISPALKGRGLFHKFISQSGLLNNRCSHGPIYSEFSFRLAANLGAKSKNPEEIVEFLRKLSWKEIVKAQLNLLTREERFMSQMLFACSIDDAAEEPLLPSPVDQLLKNDTDIPAMVGYTSHESLLFVPATSTLVLNIIENGMFLHLERNFPEMDRKDAEEFMVALKNRFMDGKPVSVENLDGFVDAFTELLVVDGVKEFLEWRRGRESAATYAYRFSYFGKQKCRTDLLVKRVMHGASHLDDSTYLFYLPQCKTVDSDPPAEGTKDRITIERMIRLWANFAKTGNPTPAHDEFINVTWKPLSKESNCYLDIGNELEMRDLTSRVERHSSKT